MAQVITTKFVAPTNTRGARIKVTGWINSATYPWDHNLSVEENHAVAVGHYVYELNKERQGDFQWAITGGGSMPDGKGYGFVIDLA